MKKIASFLLLLALGCFAIGCGARPAEVAATQRLPEDRDPRLLLERGRAFAAVDDHVRAEQYLGAALAAGASDEEVMPLLMRVSVSLKHYRLAAETAEAAIARNPKNARLRFLAGTLYAATGDVPRARELIEAAAPDLASDANVSFAIGVFFRDDALDRGKADEYFRAYLRIAPHGAHRDEATASLMEKIER